MRSVGDRYCFACGEDNPQGLQLEFFWQGDKFVTRFTPKKVHQGYPGIVHGGITAALLDEVMGKNLMSLKLPIMTGELKVRYRQPVKVGEEYLVAGWIKERKGRVIYMQSKIETADGTTVATGEAAMIIIKREGDEIDE